MDVADDGERILEEEEVAFVFEDAVAVVDEFGEFRLGDPALLLEVVAEELPIGFF